MKEFRGPLPLDDRDFADVRRRVLSKIERRPSAPLLLRFAVAAAVVALIIVLLPHPKTTNRPLVVVHHKRALVVRPAIAHVEPALSRLAPAKSRRHVRSERIASTGAPPPDAEITMNIETADPNVRIIWITR